MKKFFKIIHCYIILFVVFLLTGCSNERCFDADDFGFQHVTVTANPDASNFTTQTNNLQVGPWLDSGFTVTGQPLVLVVKTWDPLSDLNVPAQLSAWCPWFGSRLENGTLAPICEHLADCQFSGGTMCVTNSPDAPINNYPCLLRNGIGLYALIGPPNLNGVIYDPNANLDSKARPQGLNFHLGETINSYNLYDISYKGQIRRAGGLVYNFGTHPGDSTNFAYGKLYFKILDKFYSDNSGQYKVIIKSGVNDTVPDPVQFITNLVQYSLFNNDYGIVTTIYTSIVTNPSYRFAISMFLVLFIVVTVLSFLTGNIELSQNELIQRIIKFAIVSALISTPNSWAFFHDYLFVYFVEGLQQMIYQLQQAGATGPGSSSILGLMLSQQAVLKLMSLLFADGTGILYIILYFVIIFLVIQVLVEASILYLVALATVGIIISTGPIFLSFLLFERTRSLFEGWLKQLIIYSIQPIVLFTGIAFISILIRQELYNSLGFAICKYDFPDLKIADLLASLNIDSNNPKPTSFFSWWFPTSLMSDSGFTRVMADIKVPIGHFVYDAATGAQTGAYCNAYECIENRYIELPFLDPNNDKDVAMINNFFNGKYVQWNNLAYVFLAAFVLSRFNAISGGIAEFIAGGTGNSIAQATARGVQQTIGKNVDMIANKTGITAMRGKISDKISGGLKGLLGKITDKKEKTTDAKDSKKDSSSDSTAKNNSTDDTKSRSSFPALMTAKDLSKNTEKSDNKKSSDLLKNKDEQKDQKSATDKRAEDKLKYTKKYSKIMKQERRDRINKDNVDELLKITKTPLTYAEIFKNAGINIDTPTDKADLQAAKDHVYDKAERKNPILKDEASKDSSQNTTKVEKPSGDIKKPDATTDSKLKK